MKKNVLGLGLLLTLAACGGSDQLPETGSSGGGSGTGGASAGSIQFTAATYTASESAAGATLSISRTGGSSGAVSVRVRSADLTATQSQDYVALDTTVQFGDGDTATKTVTLQLTNDTAVEGTESVQLTLSVVSGGAKSGTPDSAVLSIEDDDVAPPTAPKVAATVSTGAIQLDWTEAIGATSYQVFLDARGQSSFAAAGDALPATARSLQVPVAAHLFDWAAGKFRVSACNSGGCTDSEAVGVPGGSSSSIQAIRFFKASNTTPFSSFGEALALSADGSTLAVGSRNERSGASGIDGNQVEDCDTTATNCQYGSGAVYVYARASDGSWSQQAYLKASLSSAYISFGSAVAISADGSTLVVGAPGESGAATGINGAQAYNCAAPATNCAGGSGAVYVFQRDSNGTWTQQAYVKASNTAATAQLGVSVAISADGNTVVAGAPFESSSVNNADGAAPNDCAAATPVNCDGSSGAAYVFGRTQGVWSQQAFIKPPYNGAGSTAAAQLGSSVALSADGRVLAAGLPAESSAAAGIGSPQPNDCGAATPMNCSRQSGAVYLFEKSANTWVAQASVKASHVEPYVYFGTSIALNADGTTLVAGAPYDSSAATGIGGNPVSDCIDASPLNCAWYSGAVYAFERTGGSWVQAAYIKASNADFYDSFGGAVALSADGGTLAIGAIGEGSIARGVGGDEADNSASYSGAVYVFGGGPASWSQLSYVKASNGHSNLMFGEALALSADGGRLAVSAADDAPGAGVGSSQVSGCDATPTFSCAAESGAVYLY